MPIFTELQERISECKEALLWNDVRASALILVKVRRGDGALKLSLQILSSQAHRDRLSARKLVRYSQEQTEEVHTLFRLEELLSQQSRK